MSPVQVFKLKNFQRKDHSKRNPKSFLKPSKAPKDYPTHLLAPMQNQQYQHQHLLPYNTSYTIITGGNHNF